MSDRPPCAATVLRGCASARHARADAGGDSARSGTTSAASPSKGPADVPLLDEAVLHVPAGEVFVPQPQADQLLNLFGNPGSNPDMPGLILPRDPKASWFMPVRFHKAGYIKDDDAKTWDADEMLQEPQGRHRGAEQGTREGRRAGHGDRRLVGAAALRRRATQRLVWALTSRDIGAKADEPLGVNYNTYALGRDGYFSMNMVTALADLPALKPVAEQQLAALDYNAGKRYADFDAKSGDHVAEYGLAALVVGVAAHKLGFIALALASFLAKFAKLIFIGLAVLGGSVMKFFKRKPKGAPIVPPAPAAPAFVNTVAEPPAASAPAPVDLDLRRRRAAVVRTAPDDRVRSPTMSRIFLLLFAGLKFGKLLRHRRHDAAVHRRLRARVRLALRGGHRRDAVHPRDGPLHRGAPARPERRHADVHPVRRRLGRAEGDAARRRDRGLHRPGRPDAGHRRRDRRATSSRATTASTGCWRWRTPASSST